jgi:hypothetical protein
MRLLTPLVAAVLSLTMLPVVSAQTGQGGSTAKPAAPSAPSPAGKWTMALDTPHGAITMSFDLQLSADKISGTMTSDMTGTVPVTGTFADGKVALSLETSGGLDFHFTFKDPDTMTGNLSSQMGDMACAATRRKDKIEASRLGLGSATRI